MLAPETPYQHEAREGRPSTPEPFIATIFTLTLLVWVPREDGPRRSYLLLSL